MCTTIIELSSLRGMDSPTHGIDKEKEENCAPYLFDPIFPMNEQ